MRLGKYLLLDKIALGGMAELYRAKITGVQGFEKLIAVKKILPHLADEQDLVTSLIDEAKLAALLNHQNIVQIYDFGSIEGSYFIAMEYLFGKDLRTLTNKSRKKNRPLGIEYALYITSRICAGLDYAHKLKDFQGKPLNIIHRDISPQNILITYEGDVKIVDFGIAKAATQSTHTQAGMIKGKFAYMSPEQANGQVIDYRSDIFSTGILLYELVTGKKMFEGDTLQILARVRAADFVPAEKIVEDLSEKLCDILHRALAKDPENRYQSCAEMLTDLEECMFDRSLRPSAMGLSQYMKALFAEEIAIEEETMKEVGEKTVAHVIATDKEPKPEKVPLKRAPEEVAEKKNRRGLLYGLIAAALVAVVLLVFTSGREKAPVTDISPEVASVQPSAPESIETGKAEGPLPTPTADLELEQAPEMASSIPSPSMEATAEPLPTTMPEPEAVSSREPESAELQTALAALEEKRFGEAASLLEELLTLQPPLQETIAAPYSRALQGLAAQVVETDPEKAKSFLLKAVQLYPAGPQNHFQLGHVYVRLKDYPKAIESYRAVTDLDPRFPDAFFNLGYVYAVTKDYSQAEEMYERVVTLAPNYLDEALFNLAMVQEKQGKWDHAVKNLDRAVSVNPENKQADQYLKKLKKKHGGDQ